MTNRGMVTIPSKIRKKLGYKDGKEFMVIEEDGIVKIIPLYDIREEQDWNLDTSEIKKKIKEEHESEIDVENREFNEALKERSISNNEEKSNP